MTIFIASFALTLILGVPTILAVSACMRSSQLSKAEEREVRR